MSEYCNKCGETITIVCEEVGILGDRRFQAVKASIQKETDKAFEILDASTRRTEWIPKSQVEVIGDFVKIPQWLWDRKSLKWFPGCFSLAPKMVEK